MLTFVFVSPHAVSNFMSKSLTAYTSDRIAPMIIKSVVMIDDIFDRVITIQTLGLAPNHPSKKRAAMLPATFVNAAQLRLRLPL